MWRSISTNKSSNLRKSSAIIFKEDKGTKIPHFRWTRKKTKLAFSGTTLSLTMLTGVYNSPQNSAYTWNETEIVSVIMSPMLPTEITSGESCSFFDTHTENIPHLFWRCDIVLHFWLLFQTFVNEVCKCDKYETEKDLVLFGKTQKGVWIRWNLWI